MKVTKEILIELIYKALPCSEQIKELDFTSESNAVTFTWRSMRLRIALSFFVEVVGDGVLIRDEVAQLVEALIQRTYTQIRLN